MLRFLALIYSFGYTLLSLSYLPYYLFRMRYRGRGGVDLRQRMGLRLPEVEERSSSGGRVWIHAVSVGEVNAIHPLAQRFFDLEASVLLSTTTNTGQDQAKRLCQGRASVFYFPFDWRWSCRRFLRYLRPDLVVLAETEIWPGFLLAARSLSIPVAVVNGRLSDRSFRRYRRLGFFFRPLLQGLGRLCMQSLEDKRKALEIGASPDRVHWTGNLKYDYRLIEDPQREGLASRLEAFLRPNSESRLWVCGSTREDEEALLTQVFLALRGSFPQLRLLLAPRHPHRAQALAAALHRVRLRAVLRSQWEAGDRWPEGLDVMILDSIGELPYLYRIADVVFVGGSLVAKGGQNILEAAYFGKPILFGPHMENFREISRTFLGAYGALQVRDPEELRARISDLLSDSKAAEWLGRNARKVMRDNQGAVEKTLEFLLPYLMEGRRRNGRRS